ncbi:hypothetical protein BpHYR1_003887 [Brachionus plicatilis]|uniref:Uncharacterized protein n=1 Tax=Brachionus plicatilis TaxID=10195 RepID=A0A3M7Q6I5_BRAPC|nr:hypothetical protein BpHYR1_003887 [Brachionus plicatilis]
MLLIEVRKRNHQKLCRQICGLLIKNELKKIKSEILEINLKRSDLMNIFDSFNSYLTKESTNQKNKGMISRFKNLDKNSIKIKNDHLDALYEKFDSQIVELSNVFLNEKLDLIFKHNQIVDEINQKLIESKSPNEFSIKDSQTQTSNDLSSFFKQLEKIGQSEKFKTQEIQTDINHLTNDEFLKLNSIFHKDKINSDKYSLEFDQLNFEDLLSLLSTNSVDREKTEQIKDTINYMLNDLKRQNESLNNINGELKLIICRIHGFDTMIRKVLLKALSVFQFKFIFDTNYQI